MTGLVVVDTATLWSEFGELAILVMIQVGGIGIMTLATLLGLLDRTADRVAHAADRSETGVRNRDRITVVGVKRPGEDFTYATENTVLQAQDLLIVSGKIDDVEAFADRS